MILQIGNRDPEKFNVAKVMQQIIPKLLAPPPLVCMLLLFSFITLLWGAYSQQIQPQMPSEVRIELRCQVFALAQNTCVLCPHPSWVWVENALRIC